VAVVAEKQCHATFNAVLPGFIATEAVQLHDPKMLDRIRARTPMKRLGWTSGYPFHPGGRGNFSGGS